MTDSAMDCPRCRSPLSGFVSGCLSCGHRTDVGIPKRGIICAIIAAALALTFLQAQSQYARTLGSSRNVHSNRLERMAAAQRSKAFSSILRDSGEICPAVTRYLFRGDIGTNALWTIRCSDGTEWTISIAQNNWTRVTNCARLSQAGTPCWTRI